MFNPHIDEVLFLTNDKRLYSCAMSDKSLEDQQKACSVQYNLMKHFLTANEEQQEAAIKFINKQMSVFDKINLVSYCAFNGDSKGLELALHHDVPYIMSHEGKTPFDECLRVSDFTAMDAIYKKMC